jgi:hypothetical protein
MGSDMPEEIWIIDDCHTGGEHRYKLDGSKKHPQQKLTKYTRADLAKPDNAEALEALDRIFISMGI